MSDRILYTDPLITRYAGREMQENFGDEKRFRLWRKLWIALAESEMELGLPITQAQVDALKAHETDIDYARAEEIEREVRHDVMAHVRAYGEVAPEAAGIIHLGATSCFVDCNSELIVMRDGLEILRKKLVNVMERLRNFALSHKDLPTLGFTHMQPAQLTTVGKRAALWLQDLLFDYQALDDLLRSFRLRGVKGTTGTQASFLQLFGGDGKKVAELERRVCAKLGFDRVFGVTGQTYPRKFDYRVLGVLSQIAQSAYKFSNDIRLLQSMKEMEEPFGRSQIGSSAMAYKRNPMRCERMGGLCRYLISLPVNAAMTAGTQWFERTLDDSSNRRIVLAHAFLAADAVLELYLSVAEGLVVYEKVIAKHVGAELPFMATENILMECVKAGGDRQQLHERLRVLSMEAGRSVKERGGENDLLARIEADPLFSAVHGRMGELLDPRKFVGRAPEQTEEFIAAEIDPVLAENRSFLGAGSDVRV